MQIIAWKNSATTSRYKHCARYVKGMSAVVDLLSDESARIPNISKLCDTAERV